MMRGLMKVPVFLLVIGVGILGCKQIYAQEGKGTCGIYIINADGTGLVRLTDGKDWDPHCSPDGKRIVYSQGGSIYTMDVDGSNKVKLVDRGSYPIWSPDSQQIAYSYIQYPRTYEIYVIDAEGTNKVRLSSDGAYPIWSPDGKRIAFSGKRMGIFAVNVDGTNEIPLALDYGTAPKWSLDGKKITYHRLFPGSLGETAIKIMNADGSAGIQIADSGNYPIWSPDGEKIAFSTGRGIKVINADGTNPMYLIEDADCSITGFAWSPDGTHAIYHRYKHPDTKEIYIMDADGSNKVLLTDCGRTPDWSPEGKRIVFAGVCD